jgi:Uma2 family endonuclease
MTTGRVFTECPISTADGVKAADVAWASPGRLRELSDQPCFPRAPEICVEVISPSNSESEIRAKMDLYFDAGAQEVWLCRQPGEMEFFVGQGVRANSASTLCPAFPSRVHLRSDED